MRKVDYFALGERAAIVDDYNTAATVAMVFDVHVGAKGKSAMGGSVEMLG